MSNRYQSLDVSINLNNSQFAGSTPKKIANTIDFGDKQKLLSIDQSEERVNKFRDLYFKNQKLRQQLKLLNVKLNEKLEKVKLQPFKKKKSLSVDLNVQKPTKALQRELENAYNQVAMYKKQIQTLKVKQESESTYEKYKNLQNQISFKDMEISQVESELKAIKNVKRMQDRTLVQDLQNEDLKEKLRQYERQFKESQQKLKQIAKKARKREQEYKKQQAYQVALEKKLRSNNEEQQEPESDQILFNPNKSPNTHEQVSKHDFQIVRDQIFKHKADHESYQKKIQIHKKSIKDFKKTRAEFQEKYKNSDIQLKALLLKLQSFRRLMKDDQKNYSQKQFNTGYGTTKGKQIDKSSKELSLAKLNENQIESEDPEDEQSYMNYDQKQSPFGISVSPSAVKEQRRWMGNTRKLTFGQMDSNDFFHKISGSLRGVKAWIDEKKLICGLTFTFKENEQEKESGVIGTRTNQEMSWILSQNDRLGSIDGSFTEQGYLSQFTFVSSLNLKATFGIQAGSIKFSAKMQHNQFVNGVSCTVRKLEKDTRITQLGFWLSKNL